MNLTPTVAKAIDPYYFELRTSGLKYTIQPTAKNQFVIKVT